MVMACRNINGKRHIGLQQLSSLTETGRSFLGPVKSSKFIIGEGSHESVLTCSTVRLLESLDLTSSVGQLLYETVQSQKNAYGTGTSTLLFLAGAWSTAALECLQQDIPISVIVSVMSEGLKYCREEVVPLQIPLHDVVVNTGDTRKYPFFGTLRIIPSPLVQIPPEIPWIQREHDIKSVSSEPSTPTVFSGHPSELSSRFSSFSLQSVTKGNKNVSQASKTNLITSSHTRKCRLSYSRHFNRAESISYQTGTEGHLSSHVHKCSDLVQLAVGLSHGDHNSMTLVEEAVKCQYQNAHMRKRNCMVPFRFEVSKISTCCLPGIPESFSCVCSGYITLVSINYTTVIRELQNKPLRVVLINGDFKENYRHLGFNGLGNVKTELESVTCQERPWLDRIWEILNQLKVNLVMVRGSVSESVMERCMRTNLLIIGPVSHHVLQDFAEVTGAEQVTYATQLNEDCVGSDVYVSLWRAGLLNTIEVSNRVAILIKAEGLLLTTAVLTSPVIAQMQAKEDRFWTCAYRLYHALLDEKVFLGGGTVEMLCLTHLQKLIEQLHEKKDKNYSECLHMTSWMVSSQALYRPAVLKALAYGWHKYLSSVVYNTGTCSSESEASTFVQNFLQKTAGSGCPLLYLLKECNKVTSKTFNLGFPGRLKEISRVYDVVTPKIEAWRRALDLVLLVLQTDAEIITGAESIQLNSQESNDLVLL